MTFRNVLFANDRWRWGWQVSFFLAMNSAAVAAVLTLGSISGVLTAQIVGLFPTLEVTLLYVALYAAFLGATALAMRWLRHESLGDLGLGFGQSWLRAWLIGMVLGMAILIGSSVLLSWLFGWYHTKGFAWQFVPIAVFLPTLVVTVLGTVPAGLFEEVVFRGFIFRVVAERWKTWVAVVSTSVLFALFHLVNLVVNGPTPGYPVWLAVASLVMAGLVLAQAYVTFRNLWAPFGLHFGWDLAIQLLGQQGQGVKGASLLVTTVTGSPIWQGPSGPGLGLFDLVGLALVSLILVWLRQTGSLGAGNLVLTETHP